MPRDWKAELARLDRDIRSGRGSAARAALQELTRRVPPREWLADCANLAWRASLPALGLRLLNPIVRPAARSPREATAREKAEYGVCLIKAGAVAEGETLLEPLSPGDVPQAPLYRAFARVARWDYGASIPHLEAYLESDGLTAYQRLVGQVNLAAALVEERHHVKATYHLRECLHQASLGGHRLLLGRALLLAAENFLHRREWDEAETFLRKAEALVAESDSLDHFLVRKFRAITAFLKDPGSAGAAGLRAVRKEAGRWRHWESVRDCDRYEAFGRRKRELVHHLYFGTPFAAFRDRMLAECPFPVELPERYRWRLGAGKGPAIDLGTGEGAKVPLKPGQALHRLLAALGSDFYRPVRTTEIHGLIAPDEHFHPIHSPQKIRRLLTRLRQWIARSGMPLVVAEEDGAYRLCATGPCVLAVPPPRERATRPAALLEVLRLNLGDRPFSASEAAALWEVSPRTARRHLEEAQREGRVEPRGAGRSRTYALTGGANKRNTG